MILDFLIFLAVCCAAEVAVMALFGLIALTDKPIKRQ